MRVRILLKPGVEYSTDATLEEAAALPRVGEFVIAAGEKYKIGEVIHDMDNKAIYIHSTIYTKKATSKIGAF